MTKTASREIRLSVVRWARLWNAHGLLSDVGFRDNRRLRTTPARWIAAERVIELGPRYFSLPRRRMEILCHELAHAVLTLRHSRSFAPHGSEWRALVAAAGFAPRAKLQVRRRRSSSTAAPRVEEALGGSPRPTISRHEHRCPTCHSVRYSARSMTRWRCVECAAAGLPGELSITRIDSHP